MITAVRSEGNKTLFNTIPARKCGGGGSIMLWGDFFKQGQDDSSGLMNTE